MSTEDLARSWFSNKEAQTRVAKLLRQFQLDEGAIDAEAFKLCSEDLKRLDHMLTALQFRRDKALRGVADYREILSAPAGRRSDTRPRRGAACCLSGQALGLTMASERQIGANRRNAGNSTGPRSTSGKKRASGNAFRHGLTKPISNAEFERKVERLAGQMAGDTQDRVTRELAHDAAEAELELARVRHVKASPDRPRGCVWPGSVSPIASLPRWTRPPGSCNITLGPRCGRDARNSRPIPCKRCRPGATALGRGGATRAAQAAALRSPRRDRAIRSIARRAFIK
jgi:hypothetical protein